MKKIHNPLTIIGLFAGTAEVAGTVVMPLLSVSVQKIFIWYVIGFPVLLVILFFLTLNFNPKVLYAPSDFSDENNFMKLLANINENINNAIINVPESEKYLRYIENLIEKIAFEKEGKEKKIKVVNTMNGMSIKGTAFLMLGGEKICLEKSEIIIGRRGDIRPDDVKVSGLHCMLTKTDESKYKLIDLSSSNGTFLNGKLLDPSVVYNLCNNDVIKFGDIECIFYEREEDLH